MNQINNNNQEKLGLYALKTLAALFVVMTHVPTANKATLLPFILVAVPCFYLISGYFLYTGDNETEIKKSKSWISKLVKTSLILHVIVLLSIRKIDNPITDVLVPVLLTGSGYLWYLNAMWQALLIFILVRKFLPEKIIYAAPVLYLFSLLFGKYVFLMSDVPCSFPQWTRMNFLFTAIPFLSTGYLISKHKAQFTGKFRWLLLTIISIVSLYTEILIYREFKPYNSSGYFLSLFPLALCLFVLFLNINKIPGRWITYIGKYNTSHIYYFHPLIHYGVKASITTSFLKSIITIYPFLVFLLSIFLSALINYLSSKIPHKKIFVSIFNAYRYYKKSE